MIDQTVLAATVTISPVDLGDIMEKLGKGIAWIVDQSHARYEEANKNSLAEIDVTLASLVANNEMLIASLRALTAGFQPDNPPENVLNQMYVDLQHLTHILKARYPNVAIAGHDTIDELFRAGGEKAGMIKQLRDFYRAGGTTLTKTALKYWTNRFAAITARLKKIQTRLDAAVKARPDQPG